MTSLVLASTSRVAAADADECRRAVRGGQSAGRRGCRQGVTRRICRHAIWPTRSAELKARKVSAARPGDLVLGCDSVVALDDGTRIDKPGARNWRRNCDKMSGRTHRLHSAAVVCENGQPVWRAVEVATMHVRPLSRRVHRPVCRERSRGACGAPAATASRGRARNCSAASMAAGSRSWACRCCRLAESARSFDAWLASFPRRRGSISRTIVIMDSRLRDASFEHALRSDRRSDRPVEIAEDPSHSGCIKLGIDADYRAHLVHVGHASNYLADRRQRSRLARVQRHHAAQTGGAAVPRHRVPRRQPDRRGQHRLCAQQGRLIGENTDGEGFLEPLQRLARRQQHLFRMARVLGAGGAARAVATSLADHGFTDGRSRRAMHVAKCRGDYSRANSR